MLSLSIRQLTIESCANPPEADKKHKKFSTMPGKPGVEKDERRTSNEKQTSTLGTLIHFRHFSGCE